jgi:citrate lyase synthetase
MMKGASMVPVAKEFVGEDTESTSGAIYFATRKMNEWVEENNIPDYSIESVTYNEEHRRITTIVAVVIIKYFEPDTP